MRVTPKETYSLLEKGKVYKVIHVVSQRIEHVDETTAPYMDKYCTNKGYILYMPDVSYPYIWDADRFEIVESPKIHKDWILKW